MRHGEHRRHCPGKPIIHPSRGEVVNQIFTPTREEVDHARRVIEAFEAAREAGKGASQLDGELVENLHVEIARRILMIAEKAGLSKQV